MKDTRAPKHKPQARSSKKVLDKLSGKPKQVGQRKQRFQLAWKELSVKVPTARRARADRYAKAPMSDSLPINQIIAGDSVKRLNALPEGWADLCFADPPFNIGYLYHNYEDRKDVEEYVKWSRDWMQAVYRALKPTGSFYLAIGDEFAADLAVVARREIGFHMRNWIIWHYTFGQQTKKMFAKSHTHILYFTKQKPEPGMDNLVFNADAIRVASARQTVYGDHRANSKGKLPDDTWFLRPQETSYVESGFSQFLKQNKTLPDDAFMPIDYFDPTSDSWYVSRVCGTFKEREGWHGCQMPIGVLDRIIKASSNPGQIVLDPFNGSGTTAVSAALLGRKYVGIDQSAEYVRFAESRIAHALKARDSIDKPVTSATEVSSLIFSSTRASKKQTATDAFGRQRVPRGKRGSAKPKRNAGPSKINEVILPVEA
jgi:site-specific DNA-methyltransferase (adenine-specific)